MKTKRYHLTKSGELEIEFVPGEVLEAYDALAREALGESRASITMAARYLNAALWRLPLEREPLYHALSVGARCMRYDPERVVDRYRDNPDELARDCLHAVLHCVFHHPFDRRHREADTWSLACDIAVELCALELAGTRFPSEGDPERLEAAKRLSQQARNVTAPALYQLLRHGGPGEQLYMTQGLTGRDLDELRALFTRDAHGLWANGVENPAESPRGSAAVPDMRPGASDADAEGEPEAAHAASSPSGSAAGNNEDDEDAGGADGGEGDGAAESDGAAASDGAADTDGAADSDGAAAAAAASDGAADTDGAADEAEAAEAAAADTDTAAAAATAADTFNTDDEMLEEWRTVSKRVEAEMRMQRRRGTSGDGSLFQNLSVANKKPADYDSFLKRFATLAEDIRVNDDEFDYVFYTYGLSRYGNMPLVEPLEYVESSRVREFVIVLDTSGSCSGELIRTFVQRTYDILRQRTSFGDDINVHIVQCDKEIRAATKITSLRQLEEYRDSFWVSGGGGTDFRPAFAYVDSLVEQGEFSDLRGLIYFTDGYGSFPVRAPDYEVAFVFVDAEGQDVRVPPWAMKVIMTRDEVIAP